MDFYFSIVCIEICENECKYDWKIFFFFFEGWLFEREKNTRFARFWNISDVSGEGYFFDMNKNWIYRWNGLLCKIEA